MAAVTKARMVLDLSNTGISVSIPTKDINEWLSFSL
jgi:hypothetical protein